MIILGLDVGSTACKCVAFFADGKELNSSYKEYSAIPGTPNLCPKMLRDAVFSVIHDCAGKLENKNAVAAISVSSFGESIVALDKSGNPIDDILMYYVDTHDNRFSKFIDDVGFDRIIEITRVKPDNMYSLTKIFPVIEKYGNVWKFLQISDYIVWCLSGETVTDYTFATRTLLFDLQRLKWSDELLGAAEITNDMLPEVVRSGKIIGKLTSGAATELGLGSEVKIVICAQDQVANAVGAGVYDEGDAVDGNGTVECLTPLFTGIPGAEFTKRNYVTVPYLSDGDYVTYAFNFTGGTLLKWYRCAFGAIFNGNSGESFYDYMNATCPTTPSDIIVLPQFMGFGGTPDMVRSAKGILYGLDLTSDAHTIYRALLEGLSFEIRHNIETLNKFGIFPNRIFATGGGAKSDVFLQIKADIWDCEVIPVLTDEVGAQGAAIMALAALENEDITDVAKRFIRYGKPYSPNSEYAEIYNYKYKTYKTIRDFSLSMHG